MKNPIISYFPGGIKNTTKQYRITLAKLFHGVTTCQDWKIQIEKVRYVLLNRGKGQEYKAAKAELPYFVPGGIWSNRTKSGRLLKDSNLVQIDIDNIFDPAELERIRQVLINDEHTLLQFLSPSAMGFKAFFALPDGYTQNHRLSVSGYFQDNYGIEVDPVVLKNNKTACYISFDELATFNPNCKAFDRIIEQPPLTLSRGYQVESVSISGSLSQHEAAFCKKIIEAESELIGNAPEGKGSKQLNLSSYAVGRYKGLPQDDAAKAFKQAFLSRNYSKHDDAEFYRIFNAGFDAGRKRSRPIPDRPPVQQK